MATFVRLLAYLNTRWAREGRTLQDAPKAVLSQAATEMVTGCKSLARARRVLQELAVRVSLTVHEQGSDTEIHWPKFAKFQYDRPGPRDALGAQPPALLPPPHPHPHPHPHPPQPPQTGGADLEGRNRSPRRLLRERARAAGVDDEASDRAVQALELCSDLTPSEIRYLSRTRGSLQSLIDGVLAERPKRLVTAPPEIEPPKIDPRLEHLVDRLAERAP